LALQSKEIFVNNAREIHASTQNDANHAEDPSTGQVNAEEKPASTTGDSSKTNRKTKRKKKLSARKLAANRKNAKKSTGPRTTHGKSTSSRNSWRHGLFAKATSIRSGRGQENWKKLNDLHKRLIDDHKPVGITEELIVEQMAVYYWQLQRVMRYESGEIRNAYERNCSPNANLYDEVYDVLGSARHRLMKAKDEVKATGTISVATNDRFLALVQTTPKHLLGINQIKWAMAETRCLSLCWSRMWDEHIAPESVLGKGSKRKLLAELDSMAALCEEGMSRLRKDSERYRDIASACGALPPDAVINKVLR